MTSCVDPRPILNRFPRVRRIDLLTVVRPAMVRSKLEHPAAPPRRDAETLHRGAESPRYFRRPTAVLPHLARSCRHASGSQVAPRALLRCHCHRRVRERLSKPGDQERLQSLGDRLPNGSRPRSKVGGPAISSRLFSWLRMTSFGSVAAIRFRAVPAVPAPVGMDQVLGRLTGERANPVQHIHRRHPVAGSLPFAEG